ncbi:T-complex protein 1 subunit eta [Pancytospora epiphaga]|nr:T-complex protein 1 subunit eta [Pancytospora epiphaga]
MSQLLFQTEQIEDSRSGISQILSNIAVCNNVSQMLSTTLGPYGLDKLFYGKTLIVTNDGATILENMEFKHPIARMLASLSKTQDKEVGDGTTSVIILAAEILNSLSPYIRERYPLEKVFETINELRKLCVKRIDELSVELTEENLKKLAQTCLNSKSIRNEREYFADMLIKGLSCSGNLYISKVPGGSLSDTVLVDGIAFEKTFTYAGYDQQPKKIKNPKICLLNVELEWKSEKENAEIRVEGVGEYQKLVDSEWGIIREKLDDIISKGANVVLSSLPIGDYATQYFASKNVFSAGRVQNLDRICESLNGSISSSTKFITLCTCDLFEERQLGKFRYNYFEGAGIKTRTLILRGPGSDALEEVERAVHDATCVIKTALKSRGVVTGGGSVEMQLSKMLRDVAISAEDERVLICKTFSKAFEKIPSVLAANFGLDSVFVVQELRKAHSSSSQYAGVCLNGVGDMFESGVFEPAEVKKNMVSAAFNVAEAILLVDSTIIARK